MQANPAACRILGLREEELLGNDNSLLLGKYVPSLQADLTGESASNFNYCEQIFRRKDGTKLYFEKKASIYRDITNNENYSIDFRDISERKQFEDTIMQNNIELSDNNKELKDLNTTLRVLVEHREKDRHMFNEQILTNMRMLVFPYLEQLKIHDSRPSVVACLNVIQHNLEKITSGFVSFLNSEYRNLTALEIRIADLIRAGQTSKDIASLLNISIRTAESHRANIRKKLGLSKKKKGLSAYLSGLNLNPF